MKPARLEIVLDELVFRGLSPAEARAAAAALEARLDELARAARPRVPPRSEAFRRLPPVDAAGSPRSLGEAVAGAVWRAIESGGSR